jgi:hypothetical protein
MFANKFGAYLSEATLRCCTLGKAPGFTHKHKTRLKKPTKGKYSSKVLNFGRLWPHLQTVDHRLERFARYRDKHSSLLRTLVNYGRKKVL